MQSGKETFNRTLLLAGARIFGIIFSFAIPMYLGRHLDVSAYGTYKQVMLIYWFSQIALHLGFDDSVYYLFRIDRKNFPLFSVNALLFNLSVTGLIALVLTIFRQNIASLLNNLELAQYLPILGFLIIVTLSSMQMEGLLINLDRFKTRLYLDSGTELLKAIAIMGSFYFFDSLQLSLILLSIIMTLRLFWTIQTVHTHKLKEGLSYRDARKYFKTQMKFALPLGISRIVQNVLNMENLFVSSFFNITQFTYYSVGCFENPLINSVRTSMYELVNMDLVDAVKHQNYDKAADIWRRMTRKLFLVVVPFTIYMIFFAKEMITFIFSEKYLESVPYFMIFNLYIFIASLNPEPLFRSTSQTAEAMKIRIFGVGMGLLMIIGGAYWIGPFAVLWGKLVAVAFINITGLFAGAKLIKTNILSLFVWRDLGKLTLISLTLSFIAKSIFMKFNWHPFWILAASFSMYFVFHFLISYRINIITKDEVDHLRLILNKLLTFGKKQPMVDKYD